MQWYFKFPKTLQGPLRDPEESPGSAEKMRNYFDFPLTREGTLRVP